MTGRRRARHALVGVLVGLFAFGAVATLIGTWARQTALDTDSFVAAVHPLPRDPEVGRALALFLTDELFTELDVVERAQDALPDDLQFLAAPLEGVMRNYTQDAVQAVLRSDQFDRFWDDAVRTSHRLAVQVLEGDTPPGLGERDGQVVLDLVPTLHQVIQGILDEAPGILGEVDLPDLGGDVTRDEIRSELSDRFDVDVPADFGQIVVFQEDRLSEAQDAVHLVSRLMVVLVVATFLVGVTPLVLSADRRRSVVQLGLATAAATYLVLTLVRVVADDLVDLVPDETNRRAALATADVVSRGLRDRAWYLLVGALVVAAAAYLIGPGRVPVWARGAVRTAVGRARGGAASLPASPAGRWLRVNVDGLRVMGAVVAFAVVARLRPSWTGLVVVLVVLGAYEVALTLYPRLGVAAPD